MRLTPGASAVAASAKCGAQMRSINNLQEIQIVLKELLDKKDRDLSKAKDQRGHQIKNGGDATDPQDFVTLRQLQSAFPPGSKVVGTTIITKTTTGGGGVGPTGPPGETGPQGPPGPPGVANAQQEVPIGTLNGTNKAFTLSQNPVLGTLILQLNGVTQLPGGDYTIAGVAVNYLVAPKATDWHLANYFY